MVARSQSGPGVELSWDELRDLVARCRTGLVRLGVRPGDRVVAYLPNGPEALVAFLATASLGAIWASCPPEFGAQSVIDRFGQLDPVVLLVTRGYRYGAKQIDRHDEVAAIVDALPTVRSVLDVATDWDDLLAESRRAATSSRCRSTTRSTSCSRRAPPGRPRPSCTATAASWSSTSSRWASTTTSGPGDRFFWFSTTGWMMWNLLVSGLCVGATIVLFDGDPGWPDLGRPVAHGGRDRRSPCSASAPRS